MKIAVCIKQVPDTANVKLDPETHTLKREGVESIVNPFDLFALEAALRIREQAGGEIVAITMGPPQAEAVIKEAIGYGVDEGLLLSDRAFAGADTWATTAALAKAIEGLGGVDLVVCGKQAVDGDTAQVGPGIAQRLGLPHVAFVKGFREIENRRLVVERQMDDGFDVVEMPLPGLITVVREVGEPRPPSLKGKMRAKKYAIPMKDAAQLGLEAGQVGLAGSFTQVVKVFAPSHGGERHRLEGPPEQTGAQVIDALVDNQVIMLGS
ncbi:MAG: electron transfer flavoprotein subunit beta/FixA family protein [Proteobacteria bacterium]|nr:electron transfer flavoprotein subunit beta/FixA family protein [Pseudomonadota bacterium]MBU1452868.1 electron transfer flavoprotein subunit beta/FixA family protein [Pseudomonadota bacterium]MBU2469760.1 electron transfer flavoprotein subunit beta/FixA family protein [Pseudomonadota bacterium]MBU2516807.1 electron transfer flavoprotein subunit beta/FixA family protein [Pseudomonadota bacterium]